MFKKIFSIFAKTKEVLKKDYGYIELHDGCLVHEFRGKGIKKCYSEIVADPRPEAQDEKVFFLLEPLEQYSPLTIGFNAEEHGVKIKINIGTMGISLGSTHFILSNQPTTLFIPDSQKDMYTYHATSEDLERGLSIAETVSQISDKSISIVQ